MGSVNTGFIWPMLVGSAVMGPRTPEHLQELKTFFQNSPKPIGSGKRYKPSDDFFWPCATCILKNDGKVWFEEKILVLVNIFFVTRHAWYASTLVPRDWSHKIPQVLDIPMIFLGELRCRRWFGCVVTETFDSVPMPFPPPPLYLI